MSKGNPKVYARLEPAIRKQLEEIAQAHSITLSEAVRAAILDYIAQHENDRAQRQE